MILVQAAISGAEDGGLEYLGSGCWCLRWRLGWKRGRRFGWNNRNRCIRRHRGIGEGTWAGRNARGRSRQVEGYRDAPFRIVLFAFEEIEPQRNITFLDVA